MIKKILAVGDSFTYGEELASPYDAWPYRLGDLTSAEVVNAGQPAASNDKILRIVLETLVSEPDIDLVVIGWTSPGRIEYADENGYFDLWPGYSGNLLKNTSRMDLLDYINRNHNDCLLYKRFIHQVILAQQYLQSTGTKYIMMNTLQNEHYKQLYFDGKELYFNKIDKSTFLGFEKSGMVEWAYGCPKGPAGHFLAEGHRLVAEKIYDHIRYLSWLS